MKDCSEKGKIVETRKIDKIGVNMSSTEGKILETLLKTQMTTTEFWSIPNSKKAKQLLT